MTDDGDASPFRYHLALTPKQLKITHTALRALRDDFGHDEAEVHALVEEVLAKLPDEHAIRAIQLDREPKGAEEILAEPPSGDAAAEPSAGDVLAEAPKPADIPPADDDEPPPTVA